MTHEEYQTAANYWKNKDRVEMPKEQLKKIITEYIQANNTCALATGTGDYERCTPVEYSYHDGKFWIFSEGYNAHAEYKKIPLTALHKLNPSMNLICIEPVKIESIFSEFKQEGYDIRQTYYER